MPEMPEVETLARKLRKTVIGKKISRVALSGLPLRRPVPDTFAVMLEGRSIHAILRRGKYLIVELKPKSYWLIHLGMSGRLLLHRGSFRGNRHTHAVVSFSDATVLEYRDPRRFGLLAAYETTRPERIPELHALGKDPLSRGFNEGGLRLLLGKSRRDLKSFLLDQSRIAGLGNIYACEALYRAGIHPARRCFTLSSAETACLVDSIRLVLRDAIRNRGTSFSDFIDLEGNPGKNQNFLNVFQKDGEPCPGCGDPIQRIRQGNRSTFLCPNCQK